MKIETILFDLVAVQRDNGYKYNFELRQRLNQIIGKVTKKKIITQLFYKLYPKLSIISIKHLYQRPHIEVTFHTGDKAFIVEFTVPF